ncbi:hypothetical protein EZV73_19500 [Acidaminobacter sp. JC074]|uniref:hypothetical protein n=1 Tax=Acidaminobacter sp. JC074 TaxID=2530199 RepID=UPI001F0E1935|nr:hypothetical protein [Acidaminobacter sp. JC074]MCH4889778.1 hypothetical protein [Acidaminobacter sp. JC074]
MKKNFKNKTINYTHKGYALYDNDLSTKYFIESLEEVISLHDAFKMVLKDNKLVEGDTKYTFEEIHTLDQMGLKDALGGLKEKAMKSAAEFKLIYFHGNLRGFYYRFNGFIFDERSVKNVLKAIEKQYFKGKYKQTSTSYSKWLESNHKSFKPAFMSGQYTSFKKLLTLDENLTKRVRQHLKENDLTLMQFMTGVVGVYYKAARRKDLQFETNYFNEEMALVGNTKGKKSYQLKKNPNVLVNKFIKNDWVEKDQYASVVIDMYDDFKDLKGSINPMTSTDVPYEIGFFIKENDWDIHLDIVCQKFKFKNDELFLMLTKLRTIIYDTLENDTKVSDLNLLTKQELDVALSHIQPKLNKGDTSVYKLFKLASKNHSSRIAFKGSKSLTFEKLDALVEKFKKSFDKKAKGQLVNIQSLSDFEQVAAFIALSASQSTYGQTGLDVKKGLFGYKLSGSKVDSKGLYNVEDDFISDQGYCHYCHYMKQYLHLTENDQASLNDLIEFGMPVLLAGGAITNAGDHTIAYISADKLEKSETLKHVFTDKKVIREKYNFKLHYGIKAKGTVPYAFVGPFKHGKLAGVRPVDGLAFVLLNKQNQLTQAFEKGKVYVFGPSVSLASDIGLLDLEGHQLKDVKKLSLLASWSLDGSVRF